MFQDGPNGEPAGRYREHADAEARRNGACCPPRSRRRRLRGRINSPGFARRLKQDAFVRSVEETSFVPDEVEEDLSIVRIKHFPIKPMCREEAVLQMNLLEHNFFAFRDEDNEGAFAVVYKRNDGGYGLIEDKA